MKSILNFICLIALTIALSSCSSNGPEGTAVKFTKAIYTADSDKAISYCTKESRTAVSMMLSIAAKYLEEFKATDPDVEVIRSEVSEDGTKASVDVRITNYYDILEHKVSEKSNEETLDLKKINDEWKVVVTK